ncbi:G/U mismatch-specific DNA glycosylase [Paenibacillus popilliae]|uniref:G/U mismatch-specific DNA glycosylase n=1 Tax=Paenibacillus popilliae TaxID=78057 RepID=A0ABY3ALD5_PAEPP|nr:G/U mismatch-specific DNA glycosylase [Paenibacillus sp. SDF0028]TQR43339.1 G/U mismatch-specific DNA glycosylase [Paenibacillus sp. SDF0028]
MDSIPDHLAPHLRIVFVGFNPSLRSGATGNHYANPRNRFWQIIYRAGLTPRLFQAEEDGDLIELGYGFTNIVARPTRAAAEITAEEYAEGRQQLRQKIEMYKPRAVCFVGKGVYEKYSGRTGINWGVQADPVVEGVYEFVAPSSSGLVRMKLDEIVSIYARLTEALDSGGK